MALAKPLFAEWPGPYLLAIGAAIAVLAANVAWVLWSDEAFQEATAEAEARRAARKLRDRPVVRARTVGWTLAPSGRTETLFVWKNAVQMLRGTTGVTAVRYIAPAAGVTVGVTSALMAATRASGAAAVCGMLALALAAFTIVLPCQEVSAFAPLARRTTSSEWRSSVRSTSGRVSSTSCGRGMMPGYRKVS